MNCAEKYAKNQSSNSINALYCFLITLQASVPKSYVNLASFDQNCTFFPSELR